MVAERTVKVKKLLETSLGKIPNHDGDYIIKVEKRVEKKFIKLFSKNRDLFNSIVKRLMDISYDKFWTDSGRTHGNNDHRATVGRIGSHLINKIDIHDHSRVFVCRYVDPITELKYLMLLGILPQSERSSTREWHHVVDEILKDYEGEVFEDIENEHVDENEAPPNYSEFIHEIHAGFLGMLTEDELNSRLKRGYSRIDPNITITYDQIEAIQNREPPLLIDGHAGTGKSVIIALRIALETVAASDNDQPKRFLLIAYNQRVVEMVKEFARVWTRALNPDIQSRYYDIITYETTLRLYRDLLRPLDREAIPDPNSIKSISKIVNFYRFEHQFFNSRFSKGLVSSPEQAWHFIRGILKGNGHGWRGEKLNLEDFRSISESGKIRKKLTEGMNKDLISELLKVHADYEKWRVGQNNSLDELDIVRLATKAVESFKSNGPRDSHPYRTELIQSFDTVFIDEAQDLTMAEFDLLNKLLHEEGGPARFIVGGDPLQTINPTGFSWHALETYLHELLGRTPDSERMLVSHRLTKSLVNFANVIIHRRSDFTQIPQDLMSPANTLQNDDSSIVRVSVDLEDHNHRDLLEGLLTKLLGSSTGILVWARDAEERAKLIQADPVLSELQNLAGDEQDSEKIILHSVESVKGLEYDNVIFYRFGDLNEEFTALMEKSRKPTMDEEDNYRVLYHLNRLFIAATRAKKNVYILDGQDSISKNWNEEWWMNTTNIHSSLKDFSKSISTEPKLEVADMYLNEAIDKADLDKANYALLIAKACPDSVTKSNFIIKADILRTELEIELNGYNEQSPELRRKREHLVKLFSQTDQKEKAIEIRLELGQWEDIHEEFEKGGLPKSRKFRFYELLSGLHKEERTLENLEEILKKHGGGFKSISGPIKSIFRNRINEFLRDFLYKIDNNSLQSLRSWNYDLNGTMDWMRPSYRDGMTQKNKDLDEEFRRRLEIAFGDETSWSKANQIKFTKMRLENPTLGESKTDQYTTRLASLGDYNAGMRQIRKDIENTDSWDVCSHGANIYSKILRAIEQGIAAHDTEFSREYELMKPRLKFLKSYRDIRKTNSVTPHKLNELVELFTASKTDVLCKDLREDIKSNLPLFKIPDVGAQWDGFENNFLHIQPKIQEIMNNLMESVIRNKKTPQKINESIEMVNLFCRMPLTTTPRFWNAGVEALLRTAEDGKGFDSDILFAYISILDDEQVKKFHSKEQKNKFGLTVYRALKKYVQWSTIGENFSKFSKWLVNWLMGDEKRDPEFNDILRLYILIDKHKNGEEQHSNEVWKYMLILAEKAEDATAYSYIVEHSGVKAEKIDISVHIKSFNKKASPEEMMNTIDNNQEFDLGQIPWFAQGPIPKKMLSDVQPKNPLSAFRHLMSGALVGLNLGASMIWCGLTEEGIRSESHSFMDLAKQLHTRIMNRCNLYASDHEFWNVVVSDDQVLDYVKPKRHVDLHTFKTYAVVELLFLLNKEDNKSRIKLIKKYLIPKLRSSLKKQEVVEELFNCQLFVDVFEQDGEDFEQSKQYGKALLLGISNPE